MKQHVQKGWQAVRRNHFREACNATVPCRQGLRLMSSLWGRVVSSCAQGRACAKSRLLRVTLAVSFIATALTSVSVWAEEGAQANEASQPTDEVERLADIQEEILSLNRDLFLLEEDLLFPPNTQVVVFVSWQGQTFFNLDSIELKVDSEVVAAHLYTKRQKQALQAGGLQRLYLGNLRAGEHEVTAVVTGVGPENRSYRRAASLTVEKTTEPLRLALRIQDNGRTQQPEFSLTRWAAEE